MKALGLSAGVGHYCDPVVQPMVLAVACDIHPLNNSRVLGYLRSPIGYDEVP